MDRGPVALFAAIVAVGLGPALWVGAQFGNFEGAPSRPPAVVSDESSSPQRMLGGSGAGDKATDEPVIRTNPRGNVRPLTRSPSATPSPSPSRTPTPSPSADPSGSGPSTPPTESTTTPTGPPSSGNASDPAPPSPPQPSDGGSSGNPEGPGAAGFVDVPVKG